MVFSSLTFLFYFLPLVLVVYYAAPVRLKNAALLLASLAFYTWGSGWFVLVLLGSIAANFAFGQLAGVGRREDRRRLRSLAIWGACLTNLGLLAYFKYANFAVAQVDALGQGLGAAPISWLPVLLPVGISFFTFQSITYTIDIARGRTEPLRSPLDFGLYVALFPQLVAGPIVRFHEIAEQLRSRRHRLESFADGVTRFAWGLAKKVIVADSVARIADAAYALPAEALTTEAAWLGTLAFTIQIYFDFSGYSDMAIGLGLMFGFRLPENFRRPYSAISITDFWRRWHITLSAWFRDYLYVPLGGSRVSAARGYLNLTTVFLLTGLWHGANWTYLAWGAFHGALLIAERATEQRPTGDAPGSWLRRGYVLVMVTIGWVLFRAESMTQAADVLTRMFVPSSGPLPEAVHLAMNHWNTLVLAVGCLGFVLPRGLYVGREMERQPGAWALAARLVLLFVLFPYTLTVAASGTFSPFLYFQF